MVPIRHQVNSSIHNVFTARIVPKFKARQSAGQTDAPAASTSATATAVDTTTDPAADFKSLFGHQNPNYAAPSLPVAAPVPQVPTLQSVFGPNPFVTNAGGTAPNGYSYSYNPIYFATQATAQKLAQMYGGTVIQRNDITPNGGFQQNQMNQMVQFPNGNVVNAGALAMYYSRGWTQAKIDLAIQGEINGIPT